MSGIQGISAPSDKLKKALLWLSESLESSPEKKRTNLMQEAQMRFDLSPADCEFLNKNFKNTAE